MKRKESVWSRVSTIRTVYSARFQEKAGMPVSGDAALMFDESTFWREVYELFVIMFRTYFCFLP